MLQVLALASNGSFFAHAGNDDLAEELYFQIRERLLEEFDNTPGRIKVVILERDG